MFIVIYIFNVEYLREGSKNSQLLQKHAQDQRRKSEQIRNCSYNDAILLH